MIVHEENSGTGIFKMLILYAKKINYNVLRVSMCITIRFFVSIQNNIGSNAYDGTIYVKLHGNIMFWLQLIQSASCIMYPIQLLFELRAILSLDFLPVKALENKLKIKVFWVSSALHKICRLHRYICCKYGKLICEVDTFVVIKQSYINYLL